MRVGRSQHEVWLQLMEAGNVSVVPTDRQWLGAVESHGSINKEPAVSSLTGASPAPSPLATTSFLGTELPSEKQSQATLGSLKTHLPTSSPGL